MGLPWESCPSFKGNPEWGVTLHEPPPIMRYDGIYAVPACIRRHFFCFRYQGGIYLCYRKAWKTHTSLHRESTHFTFVHPHLGVFILYPCTSFVQRFRPLVESLGSVPHAQEMKWVSPHWIWSPYYPDDVNPELVHANELTFAKQIVDFVVALNRQGLAHTDLHLRNLRWNGGDIKVVDWECVMRDTRPLSKCYDVTGTGMKSPGGFNMFLFAKHPLAIRTHTPHLLYFLKMHFQDLPTTRLRNVAGQRGKQ